MWLFTSKDIFTDLIAYRANKSVFYLTEKRIPITNVFATKLTQLFELIATSAVSDDSVYATDGIRYVINTGGKYVFTISSGMKTECDDFVNLINNLTHYINNDDRVSVDNTLNDIENLRSLFYK